jgi:Zn-dependent peptidase ImmA (M78 family)
MIRSHLARQKAIDILRISNITTAPISLDIVCKKLGFEIVPYEFPDSMSALFIIENNIKAIGVNKNHPRVRQRFSVAHEL